MVALLLGLLALVLLGAAAHFVPVALLPDARLLLVVAIALHVGGAWGLLVTAALGYGSDLLSGAPLGQSALLGLAVFAAARLVNATLEIRRPMPTAIFVAAVAPLCGLGAIGIGWAFGTPPPLDLEVLLSLAAQALINAICAPFVSSFVGELASWTGEDEGPRRGAALVRPAPLGGARGSR